MIEIEVEGIIKEIMYKGEKSCRILISNKKGEIACTITKKYIELSQKIQIGKTYKLKGRIDVYTCQKKEGKFIENVFYVNELELKY